MNSAGPDPFTLLCDADGCLFPSEEPAYEASAVVMAQLLDELGVEQRYTASDLRTMFTGMNFRATAAELARRHGVHLGADMLESWVLLERDVVTAHLGRVLQPDPAVSGPLLRLTGIARLAVVSSSAAERVDVSLSAAGLSGLFPAERRFSAETLRPALSKPDPAVYLHALSRLQLSRQQALAVEDSVVGVRAAAAAGVPVLGLVQFARRGEAVAVRRLLSAAGAACVVDAWDDVVDIASRRGVRRPFEHAVGGVDTAGAGSLEG